MRENNPLNRKRNRLHHSQDPDFDTDAFYEQLWEEECPPDGDVRETGDTEARAAHDGVSEMKKAEKGKRKRKSERGRKLKISLIIFLVLMLVLAVGTTTAAYFVTHSETVFPNVFLGEVYVGGMSRQQAQEALKASDWEQASAAPLEVLLMDTVSFTIDSRQAGTRFPLE